MKKIFLLVILSLSLVFLIMPKPALAIWKIGDPILPPCAMAPATNGTDANGNTIPNPKYVPCGFLDFFALLNNVYSFIVLEIATPLAVIALIIGATFMLISAGNPNLMGKGKKILLTAIIGLVLVFASWLIINTILSLLGFTLNGGNWSTLQG